MHMWFTQVWPDEAQKNEFVHYLLLPFFLLSLTVFLSQAHTPQSRPQADLLSLDFHCFSPFFS